MSTVSTATGDDLRGIASGVAFAAAYTWIDAFKRILNKVMPGDHETIIYYVISALLATFLAFIIFYLIRKESKRRQKKAGNQ